MAWTKEPPTKAGYYWYKPLTDIFLVLHLVVYPDVSWWEYPGVEDTYKSALLRGEWWDEPLKPPE